MHVDWNWIKQRPHFLAEGLSLDNNITVAYIKNKNEKNNVFNKTNLSVVPLRLLPFSRFKIIFFINKFIKFFYFWILVYIHNPSILWITFPTFIPRLGLSMLKNKIIIYDCMDDAYEFTKNETKKQQILYSEKILLRHADLVFVSSLNLKNKVINRGAFPKKVSLVRNAFGGVLQKIEKTEPFALINKEVFKVLYVGTVSDYIDFELILNCAKRINLVEFHFFGPVLIDIPLHERIYFHGPIEHSELQKYIKEYECLIMPFVINELIQGVDPIKLYEYINSNKNIICPYYDEIDRFSEFVYFYRSEDDFLDIIKSLMKNNKLKYDAKQREKFLKNNCWEVRVENIIKLIDEHFQMMPLA